MAGHFVDADVATMASLSLRSEGTTVSCRLESMTVRTLTDLSFDWSTQITRS